MTDIAPLLKGINLNRLKMGFSQFVELNKRLVISMINNSMTSILMISLSLLLISNVSASSTELDLQMLKLQSLNPTHKAATQAVQGGLLLGLLEPGEQIWLDNRSVRVAKDGSFILGFSRDAVSSEIKIKRLNGQEQRHTLLVKAREYNIERIDGLPASKVNPRGEALMKRIVSETALAKKARNRDDARQDYKAGFIWPAKGRISGVYGSQRVLNGQAKRPHYGVDIAAPKGTDAVAPAAGIITLAHPNMYFSGGTLIIDHGHGLSSTFLHLSKILVVVGQAVLAGERVAKIGATGRATGPHLDWRMNWYNIRVDPQLLVEGQTHN